MHRECAEAEAANSLDCFPPRVQVSVGLLESVMSAFVWLAFKARWLLWHHFVLSASSLTRTIIAVN